MSLANLSGDQIGWEILAVSLLFPLSMIVVDISNKDLTFGDFPFLKFKKKSWIHICEIWYIECSL